MKKDEKTNSPDHEDDQEEQKKSGGLFDSFVNFGLKTGILTKDGDDTTESEIQNPTVTQNETTADEAETTTKIETKTHTPSVNPVHPKPISRISSDELVEKMKSEFLSLALGDNDTIFKSFLTTIKELEDIPIERNRFLKAFTLLSKLSGLTKASLIDSLKEHSEALAITKTTFKQEVSDSKSELKKIQSSVNDVDEEINVLSQKIKDLQGQIAVLNNKKTSLNEEGVEKQSKLDNALASFEPAFGGAQQFFAELEQKINQYIN